MILLSLGLGAVAGFRYGGLHTRRENDTLRKQLMLQERFSQEWFSNATEKYALSQQIAKGQTEQVNTTLSTVIHLLNSIKIEQTQNLGKNEQHTIQKIIDDVKGLSPNSEFEP